MDHRIVSPIEMYSVARHSLNFYKSVVFYVRFRNSSLSFAQWRPRIEQCLRLTIDAQPRLRLQVDLARKQPCFILLPVETFDVLPIQRVQRNSDDDEDESFLNKVLQDQTNDGFSFNDCSPLWRVLFLVADNAKTFDFIFTMSHAIGDGVSGMSFFTSFVDFLSEKATTIFALADDQQLQELIPSKLPPLSSMIPKVMEKIFLPTILSKYIFPKTHWAGNINNCGHDLYETRLSSFKLSEAILVQLHNKCRLEKTTIHAAILSSLLLAITETFTRKNTEFLSSTAVNVRRFCQPVVSNTRMGVFVSGAETRHHLPYYENPLILFWPLARQAKEQINQEIEDSVLPLIQSLRLVTNWTKFLVDQRTVLPNGYQHSVEISNILSWSLENNNQQTWKILHGGFTQSANIVGGAFLASVVTVNGVLRVCISFHEQSMGNVEQVDIMKDKMRQILIDAIHL